MNRWAIFMDSPIWTLRVIRLFFEFSFKKGDFSSIAKLVDSCGRLLMSSQDRVQFMEQTFSQRPTACDTVHDKLNCGFLVTKNIDQPGRLDVSAGVGNKIFSKTVHNQCFRSSAIQVVQALE